MIPLRNGILAGYGLGGPKGCVIDLAIPELRAAAIATGLIWHAPMGAQVQAVSDIASGLVPEPERMPDWAQNRLAWLREHSEQDGAPR